MGVRGRPTAESIIQCITPLMHGTWYYTGVQHTLHFCVPGVVNEYQVLYLQYRYRYLVPAVHVRYRQ